MSDYYIGHLRKSEAKNSKLILKVEANAQLASTCIYLALALSVSLNHKKIEIK